MATKGKECNVQDGFINSFNAILILAIAAVSYLKKKGKRRFGVHPRILFGLSQGQFYT